MEDASSLKTMNFAQQRRLFQLSLLGAHFSKPLLRSGCRCVQQWHSLRKRLLEALLSNPLVRSCWWCAAGHYLRSNRTACLVSRWHLVFLEAVPVECWTFLELTRSNRKLKIWFLTNERACFLHQFWYVMFLKIKPRSISKLRSWFLAGIESTYAINIDEVRRCILQSHS